jgi:ATP-dependent RNA helicase RhlE
MTFSDYKFSPEIMKQIDAQGYATPTPIQEQAIPSVLAGKDVMGLAQTGTGKTAAFVLPMLQRFLPGERGKLRGLIIAPTRELAEQIHDAIGELGKLTGLRSATIYGGVSMGGQLAKLRRGVDILVACPGRLLDHIRQGTIRFNNLEVLVLDEADHMFDMGFLPNIREILKHVPAQRQTLFFSATMPPDIRKLAHAILKSPVTIEVGHTEAKDSISHTFFPVKSHLKTDLLMAILKRTATGAVLIFTRTKHRAKGLDEKLQKAGYRAASLQGNLSQNKRQEALNGFRDGKYDIMVATDIAARGIDVSKVSHVINYDLPDTFEAYTHRIGRTGRAARTGDAYSLVSPEDFEMRDIIRRKLGSDIATQELEGFNYAQEKVGRTQEFARAPRDPRSAPRSNGASYGDPTKSNRGGDRRQPGSGATQRQEPTRGAGPGKPSWGGGSSKSNPSGYGPRPTRPSSPR